MNLLVSSDPRPFLARLAAAYGFALARGHCFPDGNKRVALSIIDVFLRMNGMQLVADEPEAVTTIMAVAEGSLDEESLAAWIKAWSRRLQR
jgi:death-on-curing protein